MCPCYFPCQFPMGSDCAQRNWGAISCYPCNFPSNLLIDWRAGTPFTRLKAFPCTTFKLKVAVYKRGAFPASSLSLFSTGKFNFNCWWGLPSHNKVSGPLDRHPSDILYVHGFKSALSTLSQSVSRSFSLLPWARTPSLKSLLFPSQVRNEKCFLKVTLLEHVPQCRPKMVTDPPRVCLASCCVRKSVFLETDWRHSR